MNYTLPKTVALGDEDWEIRSDYRPILDICAALSDPDLSKEEKLYCALAIFYPGFDSLPAELYEEAAKACFWFIRCGHDDPSKTAPKLIDWEQDFLYIISPINRIAGTDVRGLEYLHWWTFISYYYEIGDCALSTIVGIREKLRTHKKLENYERDFYRKNPELINFKTVYSSDEEDFIMSLVKKNGGESVG